MPLSNRKIAFVGFGEFGRQLYELALGNFEFQEVIVFDDYYAGSEFQQHPFENYSKGSFNEFSFFVGIGYKHLSKRKLIIENLLTLGRNVPHLIHETCYVSRKAVVNPGCYVYPLCNIGDGALLSDGVVLNNSSVISHDTRIGRSTYISPGVVISGRVDIGELVFIGSGSVISNDLNVGERAVIGLATAVTADIYPGQNVVGNPMRVTSQIKIR